MTKYPLPDKIKALSEPFTKKGFSLYLVGGAVRDYLLGKENDDYDFTTDAKPEEVISLFPGHTIPTGIKHGTVTVRFKGESYEITTFRADGEYSDGRHPDCVKFVRNIESDLERRDFTINAFACSVESGEILDLHGGKQDLAAGLIRAIGEPKKRFDEDALRMMRACRFASRLDFEIEEETFKAIVKDSSNITKVSAERIREELFKILSSDHPAKGLELMRKTGLMKYILPELLEGYGMAQKGMHKYDVYYHIINTVQAAADTHAPFPVRLASLLHDIGKPRSRKIKDGEVTFYSHEVISEKLAIDILNRLKCSNEEIALTCLLVRNHMFNYQSEWTDSAVRRFIMRVGIENMDNLFCLRVSDRLAIDGKVDEENLSELKERIDAEIARGSALTIKDLKVNGRDLINLGIKPGPEMGNILSTLLERVIEEPKLNERETLLELVKEINN
ncbi:MAG: HD domain-containing protein [Sphaerochaetaceae bacterium]|nr:HD domain-containing protein [Sphaerochaetaceae bacterium]